MELSAKQRGDLGVALNESDLVGVAVEPGQRRASVTFAVLALPADDGPPPADSRVELVLQPVGRIAASLRHGTWNDPLARVESFELDHLGEIVATFKQQPIYGWDFLDVPDTDNFNNWKDRLSLDWQSQSGGLSHTLTVFQESVAGASRHLDLRLWFDELRIFLPGRHEVSLDEFTSAGIRWWDALCAKDPRTSGHGIVPAKALPGDDRRSRVARWILGRKDRSR